MIALIGAMDAEVALYREAMDIQKTHTLMGMTLWQGVYRSKEILLAVCGVGKVQAASLTSAILTRFDVSWVINTGVAGGFLPHEINDIVIPSQVAYHDFYIPAFAPGEEPLYHVPRNPKTYPCVGARGNSEGCAGLIISGDRFIGQDEAVALRDRFGADATDMESAAIAHVCHMAGVPVTIVRSISDVVEQPQNEMAFETWLEASVKRSVAGVNDLLEQSLFS